jgi:hypothetical protein
VDVFSELSRLGSLVRQLQGVTAQFAGGRIMRGTVSAAGAVVAGAGFTPARTAVGIYTVTFSTVMSSAPSVALVAGSTGGAYAVKVSTPPTTSGFGVTAFLTTTAANFDGEFHFIAIG